MTYRITKSCLFLRSRITSLPVFSTLVLYTLDVNGDHQQLLLVQDPCQLSQQHSGIASLSPIVNEHLNRDFEFQRIPAIPHQCRG